METGVTFKPRVNFAADMLLPHVSVTALPKAPTRDIRREDAMIQCDRIIDACSREVQGQPQVQADFRHLQSKVRRSDLPSEPLVGVHAIVTRFRNKGATTKVFYHVLFLAAVP